MVYEDVKKETTTIYQNSMLFILGLFCDKNIEIFMSDFIKYSLEVAQVERNHKVTQGPF